MARSKQAAEERLTEYRALTPIDYDHQPYPIGARLDLSDETAAPLLAVGAIAPVNGAPPDAPAD